MLSWLSANLGTILVCLVLIAVVAAIVIHLIRSRRKGKTTCGCGCANCAMSRYCHSKKA